MIQHPLPNFENRLGRSFYAAPTADVAKKLLGTFLLRKLNNAQWVGGKIVETEAYLHSGDPASHSFRGLTKRNAAMFAPPGTLYVYTIHAKHCMNVSTERNGIGAAVLIRALQPIWGIGEMQRNRKQTEPKKLTGGPAMICQALQIDLDQNGCDIEKSETLVITTGEEVPTEKIVATSRIGISRGQDLPLRFVISGTPYSSRSSARLESRVKNLS
jgi:DNA-3-methyladenine glycosylase